MADEKKRYKITNISGQKSPPNGRILDYNGAVIANGKFAIVSVDGIDEVLEGWVTDGYARVQDAKTGELILGSPNTTVTLGTRVQEAVGSQYDEFGDEDELNFDPTAAQEAVLVTGTNPIQGDLAQNSNAHKPKVTISLGTESERTNPNDLSPIPGERVREVDEASNFTIRAKAAPVGPGGR